MFIIGSGGLYFFSVLVSFLEKKAMGHLGHHPGKYYVIEMFF